MTVFPSKRQSSASAWIPSWENPVIRLPATTVKGAVRRTVMPKLAVSTRLPDTVV